MAGKYVAKNKSVKERTNTYNIVLLIHNDVILDFKDHEFM